MMDIQVLLKQAVEAKASDLHLSTGEPPEIRVDGELKPLDHPILTEQDLKAAIASVMTEEQLKDYEETLEADFSYALSDTARFRVNAFHQHRGPAVVFRVISTQIPTLEELELPDVIKKFCKYPNGLVLVTGPTGSGKSTTLAAMINDININKKGLHILTIEDPIEYLHKSKNCLINQREVGKNTRAFNAALRAALREDPDVILVGEMRDLETIRLALTAAETGHLVFATMHTNSAAKTIDRIIDAFPGGEKDMIRAMLSESLRAVVAQELWRRPEGGRIAVTEIMVVTPAIRNLIREHKVAQIYTAIQTGRTYGMCTLEQRIEELQSQKKIVPEDE